MSSLEIESGRRVVCLLVKNRPTECATHIHYYPAANGDISDKNLIKKYTSTSRTFLRCYNGTAKTSQEGALKSGFKLSQSELVFTV